MRYTSLLFVTTIFAAAAAAQPNMPAPATVTQQYSFVPVGIVAGQTLRVNLANLAGGSSVCMASISFVNSDGTTIQTQSVTANAGQTVSYSVQTGNINGSPASAEVRGTVTLTHLISIPPFPIPGGVSPTPVCAPLMSAEIVDGNGQTALVLTNPASSGITPVLVSTPPSPAQ